MTVYRISFDLGSETLSVKRAASVIASRRSRFR
jgi:hypothetical protein